MFAFFSRKIIFTCFRRGSLKSRFFNFKRRKKEPPDPPKTGGLKKSDSSDTIDNRKAVLDKVNPTNIKPASISEPLTRKHSPIPETSLTIPPLVIQPLSKEPRVRREHLVTLVDQAQTIHSDNQPINRSTDTAQPIYAQPMKKTKFRLNENGDRVPIPPARKNSKEKIDPLAGESVGGRERPTGLDLPVNRELPSSSNTTTNYLPKSIHPSKVPSNSHPSPSNIPKSIQSYSSVLPSPLRPSTPFTYSPPPPSSHKPTSHTSHPSTPHNYTSRTTSPIPASHHSYTSHPTSSQNYSFHPSSPIPTSSTTSPSLTSPMSRDVEVILRRRGSHPANGNEPGKI